MTHSLAWVTPFSKASDIGAFSRNLLTEFAQSGPSSGISPSVVVHENEQTYWSQLATIPLTGGAADFQIVSAFDFKIFNIGNNAENHDYINRLALRIPGVVIVHDLVMQHYLAWRVFEQSKRADLYARLMAEYYGTRGLDIVNSSRVCCATRNPIYAPWDTPHVDSTPLIEPFVRSAAAIVVHSGFAESLLRPLFDGPMLRLQLPWDKKPSLNDAQFDLWAKAAKGRSRCTIAAFGHIGRAKNLETVIQACADSRVLRERAKLLIAGYPGDAHYVEQLKLMVSHLGLAHMVEFEFSVSDQRLMALQHEADVFVNLRYPNTESASGSLIEQMNAGKPVVIYPSGAYAEVDDNAAVKVDRNGGAPAVGAAMERLVLDAAARVRIGRAGRAFARRMGRREYVGQLSEFLVKNEALLRQRGRCVAGQNLPVHLPQRQEVGLAWAGELDRTRWLLSGLDASNLEVDMTVFRDWDDERLRRYIVIGLFGHLDDGVLDRAVQELMAQSDRWDLSQAVCSAYLLTRIARGTEARMVPLVAAAPVLRAHTWQILSGLEAQIFISACYLGLLGREAEPNEVDRYSVRLGSDNTRNVVREFISSQEFMRRGVAPDALKSIRDWCDGTQPVVDAPEIPLDTPIFMTSDIPESARFLTAGWHEAERHGVWSRSLISGLRFRLSDRAAKPLTLAISGRAVAASPARPRSGSIACNDGEVFDWAVDNENWFTLRVGLSPAATENGQVSVVVSCRELINPADSGLGADTRNLGFCLREILVTNSAEAAMPGAL